VPSLYSHPAPRLGANRRRNHQQHGGQDREQARAKDEQLRQHGAEHRAREHHRADPRSARLPPHGMWVRLFDQIGFGQWFGVDPDVRVVLQQTAGAGRPGRAV